VNNAKHSKASRIKLQPYTRRSFAANNKLLKQLIAKSLA
jgi:hypothetical protein